MISSEHIDLRLVDRRYEGDPRILPRTCAHQGVRTRVNGGAVRTPAIHGPAVAEQEGSVAGVPDDLDAIEIRQIKDDALAPSAAHYGVPLVESMKTRDQSDCSMRTARSAEAKVAA